MEFRNPHPRHAHRSPSLHWKQQEDHHRPGVEREAPAQELPHSKCKRHIEEVAQSSSGKTSRIWGKGCGCLEGTQILLRSEVERCPGEEDPASLSSCSKKS